MKHHKPLRRLGAALIALVLVFGLMAATARERSEVTAVEKLIATILYPLQASTAWVAGKFRGAGQAVGELATLREENLLLREQVRATSQHEARLLLLEEENRDLRTELAMKQRSPYPLVSAGVIGRSPENWYRTVIINRGSQDGVQQNMAVINWQGLVGKVSHTTPFTATVQLVTDAGFGQGGFGAGARLPNREPGVIETVQGGHVRMLFYSSEPAVEIGQPVFTSGQGVLPSDLLIGYVESFGPQSAFVKIANVRPAVDFNRLDTVHVVLHTTDMDRGATAP